MVEYINMLFTEPYYNVISYFKNSTSVNLQVDSSDVEKLVKIMIFNKAAKIEIILQDYKSNISDEDPV